MGEEKKHIIIICSRLDLPGGIERAIVNTANLLQGEGHRLTIVILDSSAESFFPISPEISLLQFPINFGITQKGNVLTRKIDFFSGIKKLKTILKKLKPDVVIGTEYPFSIAAYLAAKKLNAKIFAWEHHHFYWLDKSRFWNLLYKKIYPRLDAVICLNNIEQALFQQLGCKTVVIPNFINKQNKFIPTSKTILSVGWLIKRKGFDMIPQIAANVFAKFPDWKWVVIGTGEEENKIRSEIERRGFANNVVIIPPVSFDLQEQYRNASLYVMTSRFECFPMVLLEAMSYGVPAIAFDCPTGPSFIINNKTDGLLIEQNDITAMSNGIIELLQNDEKRKAIGANAYENIDRFSPGKVYQLWKDLLLK